MNLGPNPTVANPAPTTEEKVHILEALGLPNTDSAAKTVPADADEIALVDSEDSSIWKKMTYANLKAAIIDGLSSAWGGITGDITDQEDLQTALDGKLPVAITRTAAQGIMEVTVSGELSANFPTLYRAPDLFGKEAWTSDGSVVGYQFSASWNGEDTWVLTDGSYNFWRNFSSSETVPLTGWETFEGSTGTPILTRAYIDAETIGQHCIVGSVDPVIFTAVNSTEWQLTGPSGIIQLPDGTYRRATHDGTSIDYQTYTPSDA